MIDLCEILTMAEKGGYCVPAFNVYNIETVRGVLNAAEELRSPVILQVFCAGIVSQPFPQFEQFFFGAFCERLHGRQFF